MTTSICTSGEAKQTVVNVKHQFIKIATNAWGVIRPSRAGVIRKVIIFMGLEAARTGGTVYGHLLVIYGMVSVATRDMMHA